MSSVAIKVNGTTLFSGASIGGGTLASPSSITYDSTFHPDKTVLSFETSATNAEGKQFTEVDLYIVYNTFSVAFKPDNDAAISEFIPASLRAMNHTAILDGADVNTSVWMYTKSNFVKACRDATAIHFNLHGDTTLLTPSGSTSDPSGITAQEIGIAVGTRNWRPAINVVMGQSCSTCANGSTAMANAFGIVGTSIDRAYVGFDAIAVRGFSPYELFWEKLADGGTVTEAKTIAQAEYDATRNGYYPANLVIVGDGSTTLHSLYPTKQKNPWWKLN